MHLVRAVSQPKGTRIDPELRERKIPRHAAAAVDLDSAVDDFEGHLWDDGFYHGDLAAGSFVADGIHHPGGFQYQQSRLIDFAAGFGDPLTNYSLVGDGLAKSHTRPGARAH